MSAVLLIVAALVAGPLVASADAQPAATPTSQETPDPAPFLEAGDRAVDFDLPAGDGERLVLSELLTRKQPIFLLTFRSSW